MQTLLCYVYFMILSVIGFWLVYKREGVVSVPLNKRIKMKCTGTELLLIFMFATGLMGIIPVLAIRLAVLEILCIIGIYKSSNKVIFSFPMLCFAIFLIWEIIGLLYTPSIVFGIRMVLKYAYPFLLALFASAVVRDNEIFLKATLSARSVALISIFIFFIPGFTYFVEGVFWGRAAVATHYITICILSLGFLVFSDNKIKNLFYFILFFLPCFLWVFRTDIMGIMIALSSFLIIRYRFKALPLVALLCALSVVSIFYIPSVKKKMYFRPDEVTLHDFLKGDVDETNVNTSGRNLVWEDCYNWFYKDHTLLGSGTGRVQTYFYTEAQGWRRGGQLHGDFLVLQCDNGLIGLSLYLLATVTVFIHCIVIYHRKTSPVCVKLSSITAGASLLGVVATMYSDNTVSYSMATLSYPWGIYGILLGMLKNKR